MNLDEVTHSLEVHESAGMIPRNDGLLEVPLAEIHKTDVRARMFRGRVVYNRL